MCLFGAIRNNNASANWCTQYWHWWKTIKKEWKCEKHSYNKSRNRRGESKLCYKISNVKNSIVSNGCFHERLNQIKSNLIGALCVGTVQVCMKGYQIKLTENKMRPISDRFDWMEIHMYNEFFFRIVSSSIFLFHSVNHQVEFIYM